jgi:bifunctional non-homologous end joining protein LigD
MEKVVASREDGAPDLMALHSGNYTQEVLSVWCFDLMEINGKDLWPLPLVTRKQKLETLLRRHDHPCKRYSDQERRATTRGMPQPGLEGIVCKRKHAAYKANATGSKSSAPNARKTKRISATSLCASGSASKF